MIAEKVTAEELRQLADVIARRGGMSTTAEAFVSAADLIDELEARNNRLESELKRALMSGNGHCRWCGTMCTLVAHHFEDCPHRALSEPKEAHRG